MRMKSSKSIVAATVFLAGVTPTWAQETKDRTVEQYECKDIVRESGGNRDVAIAFLHGFLLGKSGSSKFNLEILQKQTDAFLDRCIYNPTEKALDAMVTVKK
jgi:hypothetical protein